MENKKYFFAVDLGATSGRTILGTLADGRLEQEELTRFPNNLIETGNHFYWDIYALYFEMIKGLQIVGKRGIDITSIGIDTWGVDFVFIGEYRANSTINIGNYTFNNCQGLTSITIPGSITSIGSIITDKIIAGGFLYTKRANLFYQFGSFIFEGSNP